MIRYVAQPDAARLLTKAIGKLPSFPHDRHGRLTLANAPDYRQQLPYDCGADCVRIVLDIFGIDVDEEELIEALGTNDVEGTRYANIVQYLRQAGLEATANTGMTLEDLKAATAQGNPVITPIQEYGTMKEEEEEQSGHYVVALGLEDEKITLQDPVAGRVVMPADEFLSHWVDLDGSGADEVEISRFGIVVSDGPAGTRTKSLDLMPALELDTSTLTAHVEAAAAVTERNPTAAQKASGNYRKGKVMVHGLPITIETPRGATRSGTGASGPWSVVMQHHYGYVRQTESEADGDAVDIFIGPDLDHDEVYVIDQHKADGSFDEHKACIGFATPGAAMAGYMACYSPGWTGFGGIRTMTIDEFKRWLNAGDTGAPIAEQTIKRLLGDADAVTASAADARGHAGKKSSPIAKRLMAQAGVLTKTYIPERASDGRFGTVAGEHSGLKEQYVEHEKKLAHNIAATAGYAKLVAAAEAVASAKGSTAKTAAMTKVRSELIAHYREVARQAVKDNPSLGPRSNAIQRMGQRIGAYLVGAARDAARQGADPISPETVETAFYMTVRDAIGEKDATDPNSPRWGALERAFLGGDQEARHRELRGKPLALMTAEEREAWHAGGSLLSSRAEHVKRLIARAGVVTKAYIPQRASDGRFGTVAGEHHHQEKPVAVHTDWRAPGPGGRTDKERPARETAAQEDSPGPPSRKST